MQSFNIVLIIEAYWFFILIFGRDFLDYARASGGFIFFVGKIVLVFIGVVLYRMSSQFVSCGTFGGREILMQ